MHRDIPVEATESALEPRPLAGLVVGLSLALVIVSACCVMLLLRDRRPVADTGTAEPELAARATPASAPPEPPKQPVVITDNRIWLPPVLPSLEAEPVYNEPGLARPREPFVDEGYERFIEMRRARARRAVKILAHDGTTRVHGLPRLPPASDQEPAPAAPQSAPFVVDNHLVTNPRLLRQLLDEPPAPASAAPHR